MSSLIDIFSRYIARNRGVKDIKIHHESPPPIDSFGQWVINGEIEADKQAAMDAERFRARQNFQLSSGNSSW